MPPLERSYEEYRWVLLTWLKTPNLTQAEITLIQSLLDSLDQSLQAFDIARHVAVNTAFLTTLQSAARKAMEAGLLLEWSQYATQT